MHSARTVHESWKKAYDYCNKSFARLANVPRGSEGFIRDLARQVNASSVWIGLPRGARFRLVSDICAQIGFGLKRPGTKCTGKLPFVCERGERITVS